MASHPMKIERVELWHVRVPTPAPFHPAWIPGHIQSDNRFTLVRLFTAGGLEGVSALAAMSTERDGFGALLGPYFLGERADDLAAVRQRIREIGYLGLRMGWLEPACWDIIGKARHKPVYEILGGKGGRVKLYASTGEVKCGKDRAREVEARLREGFGAVKLRVHAATLEEDLEQIRETREAVGPDVTLGVDANQGWRVAVVSDAPRWDYDRALAFCKEAEALGYSWVEEPLPMDDYEGLTRLTAATEIAIAGGELNGQGLSEQKMMIERRCYDIFQPDAVFCGGIAETYGIMKHAAAAGLKYTPHTWTNGIGFGVNLQLFGASPWRDESRLEYPYDPPGWVPEARDGILAQPWQHHEGELVLPTAPGLGLQIDPIALRRYGRRFFVATKLRVAIRTILDRGLKEAKIVGGRREARLAASDAALAEVIAAGRDPVRETLDSLAPAGEASG